MFLSDMCTVSGRCGEARAYAKVNLTLDVTGKRPDGYHEILTIMRSVNLCDTINMELTDAPEIVVSSDMEGLPTDEGNIAYVAAKQLLAAAGAIYGAKIHIAKKIPCGAGMGGGSADGAAVLVLLNRLLGNPVSTERLLEIGAKVGADVPFCIMCKTAVATGIGEKLAPVEAKGTVPVLIVKPEVSISTPQMYRKLDECTISKRPDTKAAKAALECGDIYGIAKNLCNVMEPPAIEQHPVIDEIRNKMVENGALGAMMTGSGSAVFGIFSTTEQADLCSKKFVDKYKHVYSTILI